MNGAGRTDRTFGLPLTRQVLYRLSYASGNLQTAGTGPANVENSSLSETTVYRPTEGNQYRVSGLPYVLAGATIPNSNSNCHAAFARGECSAVRKCR